jgi:hypothetical protein
VSWVNTSSSSTILDASYIDGGYTISSVSKSGGSSKSGTYSSSGSNMILIKANCYTENHNSASYAKGHAKIKAPSQTNYEKLAACRADGNASDRVISTTWFKLESGEIDYKLDPHSTNDGFTKISLEELAYI